MSSKSGKSESKSRNSLPRSASSLSDDTKESEMSTASYASSTASSVSTVASTTKVKKTLIVSKQRYFYSQTTTSTYENGVQHEDWAMPGFLSLKELNSMLLKYIGQVQDLELNQTKPGASTSITVNIDRCS